MYSKEKTTEKKMKTMYGIGNIIKVSYCYLQNLLRFESPTFYTSGNYGWNADYYTFYVDGKSVCISTGYRPIGNKVSYELCREFESKSNGIEDSEIMYELIKDFIRKAFAEMKGE